MGRPRLGEETALRIPLMMPAELVEKIDDYRFANRIGTRAEAIRHLVQTALTHDEIKTTDFNSQLSGWLDAFAP